MALTLSRRQYAELFGPTVGDRVRLADTELIVEVERSAGFHGGDAELVARFSRQLQSITGVSAHVVILPPDTLPRATHKAKRVEDRRTGVWN